MAIVFYVIIVYPPLRIILIFNWVFNNCRLNKYLNFQLNNNFADEFSHHIMVAKTNDPHDHIEKKNISLRIATTVRSN